jgi:hypothetical protein
VTRKKSSASSAQPRKQATNVFRCSRFKILKSRTASTPSVVAAVFLSGNSKFPNRVLDFLRALSRQSKSKTGEIKIAAAVDR